MHTNFFHVPFFSLYAFLCIYVIFSARKFAVQIYTRGLEIVRHNVEHDTLRLFLAPIYFPHTQTFSFVANFRPWQILTQRYLNLVQGKITGVGSRILSCFAQFQSLWIPVNLSVKEIFRYQVSFHLTQMGKFLKPNLAHKLELEWL